MPKLQVVNGPSETVAFPPQAHTQNIVQAHVQDAAAQGYAAPMEAAPVSRQSGYVPEPPITPLISKAFIGRGTDELELGDPAPASAPATRAAPAVRAVTPEPQRQAEPQKNSLFKSVFGFGNTAKPAPAPHPHRQEPAMHVGHNGTPRTGPRRGAPGAD